MSKIILLSGSPRKGNTDYIIEKLASELGSNSEIIYLREKKIEHCRGCLYCLNKFDCSIKDDMEEIRVKVKNGSVKYFV